MIARDAALYALGVGACSRDPVDDKELKYVYHQDGQQSIEVTYIRDILPLYIGLNKKKTFILMCALVGLSLFPIYAG